MQRNRRHLCWHHGALETEGQYRFTPEGLEELNQTEGELKLAVILTGAKAQSAPELVGAP